LYPILFQSGGFTVFSFGVSRVIGILIGLAYFYFESKKQVGLSFAKCLELFLLATVSGLLGGEFYLFCENPSYYIDHPKALILAGGGYFGTLIVGLTTVILFFRYHRLPVWTMLDILIFPICILHIFGKAGCFLAGCCYGKPVHDFPGVVYTSAHSLAPLHVPLHATQLYEMTWAIVIFLVLRMIYSSEKKFKGQLFLTYIMMYSTGRIFLELFRGDPDRGYFFQDYMNLAQFISLTLLVTALLFYRFLSHREKREKEMS
jgi:phosphatidylglycerol:prolipoprotein diacylglycerol transferase